MACDPGFSANAEKTECVACARGTYQSLANQESCMPCDEGTSTREPGADSKDLCEGKWELYH